ncbi:MAG TPA: hypothetical protein PK289_13530, partial [Bacteroidia bacterium]|nr:hypothetical protein [Bacteroidia bacterium]
TLRWTWSDINTDIRIFEGQKQIGRIASFSDNVHAEINKKYFFLDKPKWMFKTFISDPKDDDKAYCEVDLSHHPMNVLICPTFSYYAKRSGIWPFKRTWSISTKGKCLAELEIPKGFFKDAGVLRIHQEENFELIIFSLFYFNSIND